MDWPTAVAIVALAATAAVIQSLSGFGFALFIVPFLAILIGPRDTVLLSNLLSTVASGMQSRTLRHSADRRTAVTLMAGSFAGMPIGLAVLLLLDPTALKLVIAIMVIVFTLLLMRGLELHRAGVLGDLTAGLTSGILNTSTSMSGPPVVMYLQGRGLPPLQFRATIATFFAVTSAVAVLLLLASGTAEPYVFVAFALSVPAVFIGQRIGNGLFEKVNAAIFRRMVYAILLVSGSVAIVGAVTG
ncbi:sulfite exporter TauE/SafE family protein [Candidatus Amarobacter glycogenicus]|uniref:sulfite exporter TauE/SafE family protein n=1 Tax=Candidatus Amarobacter glycogenicus TaxID=3140699 RepID=UPI002A13AAB7|nr:sulfite exporter TauE/SafE family protein [Dehalococcoidia bacterium]